MPARSRVGRRIKERPQQDSNLRTRLRRPVLYPLSYEGRHVKANLDAKMDQPSP